MEQCDALPAGMHDPPRRGCVRRSAVMRKFSSLTGPLRNGSTTIIPPDTLTACATQTFFELKQCILHETTYAFVG
jgi:hypothetical protein